jgi:hypothetical protein
MECYRHPETPAVSTCVSCGQPVCAGCGDAVAGHTVCLPCVEAAQARLAPEPAQTLPDTGAAREPAAIGPVAATEPAEPAAVVFYGKAPGLFRRVVRGWMWGILYGQWWTAWTLLSAMLWGGLFSGRTSIVPLVIGMGVIYGFFGSLTGLVIGLARPNENLGMNIGVGMGVAICLLEAALGGNPSTLINLVFFYFTGRFVGAGLTGRVMRPVGPYFTDPPPEKE